MNKKEVTSSESKIDTTQVSRKASSLGKTLAMGSALWLGMTAVEMGVPPVINGALGKAETGLRAEDARDAVIQVLAKINEEKRIPLKDQMKGKFSTSTNLRTERIGNHELKINQNAIGYVIGIGYRAFFVGKTEAELEQALNQARNAVTLISDSRSFIQSNLAYGSSNR